MSDRPEQYSTRPLVTAVLVGVAAVVGVILFYQALPVIQVIAVGMLLALVLRVIARGLENLGASPFISGLAMFAGISAFAALLYFVVFPNIAQEVRTLASGGPGSLNSLAKSLQGVPFAPDLSEILRRLEDNLSRVIGTVPQILGTAADIITGIVASVFLALYFAMNPDTYIRGMLRLVPVEKRGMARDLVDVLSNRLQGWVVGTVMVAGFVGLSAGIGLWLLGVPLALTFGILAGFLNVIPLFGSIVGGLLPVLLALTISPVKAVEVAALFVVINQIEGNLLQPRLMGKQVHVPSALILISILLLGSLIGPVVGTLLAIPAAVVAVTLVDYFTVDETREPD